MAMADYRKCDVCDGKAFYDSNLNYEMTEDEFNAHRPPYRIAGEAQPDACGTAMRLDRVGDWAVICHECAKTHKTQIVPITATIESTSATLKEGGA